MRLGHPILVVEDCDEDFETVVEAADLNGIHNKIQRASSGDECLAILRETIHQHSKRPAFVLMDLNMPKSDGRDALKEIQQDAALCGLPLVVFSTSSNPNDLNFCYAHGANAYHVKPVKYLEHLQVLKQIFNYWLTSVTLLPE